MLLLGICIQGAFNACMPSRHRVKRYSSEAYYHVYNRGVAKQTIFADDEDYTVFLGLFKRYLSKGPVVDNEGRDYQSLYGKLILLAFCLMPNHFHLLIYQEDPQGMTRLLRRVATGYAMYFNKKYDRVGPIFQDRFKAVLIEDDSYLEHISRYIHLNPEDYRSWRFSSLPYYLYGRRAEWLKPELILAMFKDVQEYENFLNDYKGHRAMLHALKLQLANL